MEEAILNVENLYKNFGKKEILKNVSFAILSHFLPITSKIAHLLKACIEGILFLI